MASVAGFAAMAMAFPPSAARNFSASAPCSCREAAARSGAFRHEAFPSRLQSGSLSNAGADWRTFKLRNPASVFSTERRLRRLVTRAAAKDSLYDTLGVSATATEKEIKQAYRRLALKFHPDVNKAPNAQEKFLEIKKAYQTLVDAQSRAKYDSSRQPSSTWEPFNWGRDSQSQRKPAQEEEFYGLDDFLRDLQSDYQKKSSQGRPKSLWEELADIGEEFVDFLEKELEIIDANGNYKEPFRPSKPYDFDPNDWTQSAKQAEEQAKSKVKDAKSKVEDELSDIEDMMAKLKKELGL